MIMKNKILIVLALFFLALPFVNATLPLTNAEQYFTFDSGDLNGQNPLDITENLINGTTNGNPSTTAQHKLGDGSFSFDGSADYVITNIYPSTSSETINMWIKVDIATTNHDVLINSRGTANRGFNFANNDATYKYGYFTDGCSSIKNLQNLVNGSWIMVTLVWDNASAGTSRLYINGIEETSQSCGTALVNDEYWYLGRDTALTSRDYQGFIDEYSLWNVALTPTEILELRDLTEHPSFINETPISIPAPTVNLSSPSNNTITKTQNIIFNYTPSSQYILTSCSLYGNFSGTWGLNQTDNTITNGSINNFNSIELDEGEYIWNVQCTDNNTNSSFADNNFTFTIDTTNPIINTNFIDGESIYLELLEAQFNFSDNTGINTVNFTIPKDNTIIFNKTGIGDFTYIYNLSYNVSALTKGTQVLRVSVADGHTAEKLKAKDSYVISNGLFNDVLRFEFLEPYKESWVQIEQKEKSLFDTWNVLPEKDRYRFEFEPSVKKIKYTFIVESDDPIFIFDDNKKKYGKWLVFGEHWIDFLPYEIKKVTRIDAYTVEVEVEEPTGKDRITFDSIGDLNIVTQDYTFENENITEDYIENLINNQRTNLSLIFTGENRTSPTDVKLEWNNTNYTAYLVSNTTEIEIYRMNITPEFDLSIVGEVNIIHKWYFNQGDKARATASKNQLIKEIGLDNCSNFTTVAFNFSFVDENNNSPLNMDLDGTFYFREEGTPFKSAEIEITNKSSFEICINPSYANFTGNYSLEYSNTNYPERSYIETSAVFDNITQYRTLRVLHIDNGIFQRIRIVTILQQAIPGVFLDVKKDISGVSTRIESELTDDGGLATFFLDPDEIYSFTASKIGFSTQTFSIAPTTEIVTVTMTSTTEETIRPDGTGINYKFTPGITVLNNDTDTTFTFTLNSSYRDITSCGFILLNGSNKIATGSTTNDTRGCFSTLTFNTDNYAQIKAQGNYTLNTTIDVSLTKPYIIRSTYQGNFSLMTFFDDLENFEDSGFNNLTRMFIALLIIVGTTALLAFKYPALRDEEGLIVWVLTLTFIFSFVGWLTIESPTIPTIAGFDLQKWILFILIFLTSAGYFIRKEML